MAPLNAAAKVTPSTSARSDGGQDFIGEADEEWGIKSVTNGGYLLSLILDACIQFQSNTAHLDPIHLTAHFLRKTLPGPITIRVRRVKTGSAFTNVAAELAQKDEARISAYIVFAVNEPNPKDKIQLTLNPPSPWARRHPLHTHPSPSERKDFPPFWSFAHHVGWTHDDAITSRNRPDHPNRTNSSTVGGGGLEWGGWFEFKEEQITTRSLGFLADVFLNTPALLPASERKGLTNPTWFATVTLSIEFKSKIPPPSTKHADRTVGMYSCGRFINHPQGRHDVYVEIWTAPSNIGEGEPSDNWRDDQVCLAVATQMALCIPLAPGSTPSAKL